MKSVKVIICDDNPRLVQALTKQIEREFPECEIAGTANNGKDGLEMILTSKPDILISDINMPELSGLDMIQSYRNKGIKPSEILITGYNEFDYAYRATKLKVFDFLMKPIDPEDFLDTFNRALNVCTENDREEDNNPFKKWRQSFFAAQELNSELINRILAEMDQTFKESQDRFIEAYQILQFWIAEWMTSHREDSTVSLMRTPIEIKNRAQNIKSLKEAKTDLQIYIKKLVQTEKSEQQLPPLVARAIRLIHQTDPRDLTLSLIAGELDISAAYLGDQIKKSTGETFSAISHQYRLGIASSLLTTTNMSVKEISAQIGFSGYRYFEKVFKKAYGQSPTSYRKYPENQFLYTT